MNPVLEQAWGIWLIVGAVLGHLAHRLWIFILSEGEFCSVDALFEALKKHGWVEK